jgi:hypothetical protein
MHNGSAGFLVIFLNIWKYIIDKIKGGARGVQKNGDADILHVVHFISIVQ